jgi:murein DD-endopeptidase MepM/ murein hydrolase activator NlpD
LTYPVPRALDGRPPRISSGFHSSNPDRPTHQGADIMYRRPVAGAVALPVYSANYEMPSDVPALAIGAGQVTAARMIGTGGYVMIDHRGGGDWDGWSEYMHLRNLKVKVGDRVRSGQALGTISFNPSDGGYSLNHLHFQLRNASNTLLDPRDYLDRMMIVLKPSSFLGNLLAIGVGLFIARALARRSR